MDEELREAEIGVIGSALLLPDQVCGLLSRWGVTPEWFGTQAAREIMACVMPMHAEGTPIDMLTVSGGQETTT